MIKVFLGVSEAMLINSSDCSLVLDKVLDHLSVFNQILSLGKKRDGRFYFDEFSAWHDVDGYTCYIGYKDLVMTIYFHSQFSFEYHEKATMKRFTKLVDGQQITFKKR